MIYLASPYSHPKQAVREQRFDAACRMTAKMMLEGHIIYSPVIHSHLLTRYGVPGDWSFWQMFDLWHLQHSQEVLVLMLNGWDSSIGVRAEISKAGELGKPVWYRAPLDATTPTLPHVAMEAST